jgi:hypothetical protein
MANTFEDMQALLAADLSTVGTGMVKTERSAYHTLIRHSNLRTYSTAQHLHACPRYYERMKLDANAAMTERVNSATFAFGQAVGAGVAEYDRTGDRRKAIWAAFLAWDIDLFEENRKVAGKGGESFYEAVWALYAYEVWYEQSYLPQYEMVNIEATVAVDFEDGHFYSGHIDELLRHRTTGAYLTKENKTDGSASIDPAKYSNSDQALSYAIVVDMLGATEYAVLYTVYSKQEQTWHSFEFVKHGNAKAEWLQDQLLINQQTDDYTKLNFFPKRGASCMKYNRRCPYYERCDMSTQQVYGITFAELPKITSIDDIDAIERVNYRTTMSAIVARQQEKLHG